MFEEPESKLPETIKSATELTVQKMILTVDINRCDKKLIQLTNKVNIVKNKDRNATSQGIFEEKLEGKVEQEMQRNIDSTKKRKCKARRLIMQ